MKRAFIRVDASASTGGGHFMRCLTLANELADRGVCVDFVCAAVPAWLEGRARADGHDVRSLDSVLPTDSERPGWELVPWSPEVQLADADAVMRALAPSHYDWVIVDHYRLSAIWEATVATRVAPILAVDDLANRSHACALLLDQTPDRLRSDYDEHVPAGATALLGSRYALLRPDFRTARPEALRRRVSRSAVERVVVSLGAMDVGALTVPAARAARRVAPHAVVDVVVGSTAPCIEPLRRLAARDPGIAVHVDVHDMASLLTEADLAIGAAGTTSWERCCLGLPTLLLVLAENQRAVALRLVEHDAAVVLEDPANLEDRLRALVLDVPLRQRLAQGAAALVDGDGASRVADAMVDLSVQA